MKLIFASHNDNKTREIRELLPSYDLQSLKDLNYHQEIPETGETLAENAEIKARTIFNAFGTAVFADDTGLIVPALNGAPGVYSARYAGPEANADANMSKLLADLASAGSREAYFETLICYIDPAGKSHFFSGKVEGEILLERKGGAGFGYDPIFKPNGYDLSFAEMSSAAKNAISHRGRALQSFIHHLAQAEKS